MRLDSSHLPEPRGYLGTAIMVGAITTLPFGVLWSWLIATMMGLPFADILPGGLVAGVLFGSFFGLSMAFFLKAETVEIGYSDKRDFVARLNVALSLLAYNPASQSEDFLTYKPSFQAGLVADRISVELNGDHAIVVGPSMYIKKLVQRLGQAAAVPSAADAPRDVSIRAKDSNKGGGS